MFLCHSHPSEFMVSHQTQMWLCLSFLTLACELAVFFVVLCLSWLSSEMLSSLLAVCCNKVSVSASHPAGNLIHSSVCLIKDQWKTAGEVAAPLWGCGVIVWMYYIFKLVTCLLDWLHAVICVFRSQTVSVFNFELCISQHIDPGRCFAPGLILISTVKSP